MLLGRGKNSKASDIFWNIAQTVQEKYNTYITTCDYCKRTEFASLVKVFHTMDEKKLFTKPIDRNTCLLTDHINVCVHCKNLLSPKWVACKCKTKINTKEKLCQLK